MAKSDNDYYNYLLSCGFDEQEAQQKMKEREIMIDLYQGKKEQREITSHAYELSKKTVNQRNSRFFMGREEVLTMPKEHIEREAAKARLRMWITDCVLDGDNEAADCFRDCIDLLDSIPAADVAPAVELEDLRAKYQTLVAEKAKNSGDTAETYTTGYRYGHRNGQIELLQQILDICDGVSEPEETNE